MFPLKVKPKQNSWTIYISETYNFLSSKYSNGLFWLMAGDTNELKLDLILHLDPKLRQVVEEPTRIVSDGILDPIITDLTKYYNVPECLKPLNADCICHRKPSDHKMILLKPLAKFNNKIKRKQRVVNICPLPESKLLQFENWLKDQQWEQLLTFETSHEKAEFLQNVLIKKINALLPVKTVRFCNEDQPFFTPELKILDRRRKNEFKNIGEAKYIIT